MARAANDSVITSSRPACALARTIRSWSRSRALTMPPATRTKLAASNGHANSCKQKRDVKRFPSPRNARALVLSHRPRPGIATLCHPLKQSRGAKTISAKVTECTRSPRRQMMDPRRFLAVAINTSEARCFVAVPWMPPSWFVAGKFRASRRTEWKS